jgi:hypothetical protein
VHLIVLLCVVSVAVVAWTIPSADAAPAGNCTHYSNASRTKVIGQRGYDCCNNYVSWPR